MIAKTCPTERARLDNDAKPERCLRCNIELTPSELGGRPMNACSTACSQAIRRRSRSILPLITVLAHLLEGEEAPGPAPPFWLLFRFMLRRSRAEVRARQIAESLP